MTLKKVFLKIKDHLLEQKKRSQSSDGTGCGDPVCKYHSKNGTKCAIGCLISPDYYCESFEGHGIETPQVLTAVQESLNIGTMPQVNISTLASLQDIHDTVDVEDWQNTLSSIQYSLERTPNWEEQIDSTVYRNV